MTNNAELQQQEHENNEAHIERLRGIVRSRREEAQRELEAKRHLEKTINGMSTIRSRVSIRSIYQPFFPEVRLLADVITRSSPTLVIVRLSSSLRPLIVAPSIMPYQVC